MCKRHKDIELRDKLRVRKKSDTLAANPLLVVPAKGTRTLKLRI